MNIVTAYVLCIRRSSRQMPNKKSHPRRIMAKPSRSSGRCNYQLAEEYYHYRTRSAETATTSTQATPPTTHRCTGTFLSESDGEDLRERHVALQHALTLTLEELVEAITNLQMLVDDSTLLYKAYPAVNNQCFALGQPGNCLGTGVTVCAQRSVGRIAGLQGDQVDGRHWSGKRSGDIGSVRDQWTDGKCCFTSY